MDKESQLLARTIGTMTGIINLKSERDFNALFVRLRIYVDQLLEIRNEVHQLQNRALIAFFDTFMDFITLFDQISPIKFFQIPPETNQEYLEDLEMLASDLLPKVLRYPNSLSAQHARLKERLAIHRRRLLGLN